MSAGSPNREIPNKTEKVLNAQNIMAISLNCYKKLFLKTSICSEYHLPHIACTKDKCGCKLKPWTKPMRAHAAISVVFSVYYQINYISLICRRNISNLILVDFVFGHAI